MSISPTYFAEALFRVPPFPASSPPTMIQRASPPRSVSDGEAQEFANAIRRERVGGESWNDADPWRRFDAPGPLAYRGDDPMALLAAIAGRAVQCHGAGPFAVLDALEPGTSGHQQVTARLVADHLLAPVTWRDPFTGAPADPLAMIALFGEWRRLIDGNRGIAAAYGFAAWKQDTVAALLWPGSGPPAFARPNLTRFGQLPAGEAVAVWKARVPQRFLVALEESGRPILEVEDGFIRSIGLGADCVPPLSIVVDDLGAHYDPSRPSRLEALIESDMIPAKQLARAARLRTLITRTGVSKYGASNAALARPGGAQRHILVTGQVEDDRSVLLGGCGIASNLDLLRRARAQCPDDFLIYRPHPDVVAGHRKGHVPPAEALTAADVIDPGNPISALIAMVDEVHVLTSLAGFEALLHCKKVVTHGVPFYAGWGLTTDLGPVPKRRRKSRSLDQLVAAVLLEYPRYLDPVTGLPCTAETLVERISSGVRREKASLVVFRKVLGWLNGRFGRVSEDL